MAAKKTKKRTEEPTWQMGSGWPVNYVLPMGRWGISYAPMTDQGEETALVKGDKFYILRGDYRKDYEELAPKGFKACKEFFDSKDNKSVWSN